MFVDVLSFMCNLSGDGLSGCADGEWLSWVFGLWCCLSGGVHLGWVGRGGGVVWTNLGGEGGLGFGVVGVGGRVVGGGFHGGSVAR